MGLWLTCSKPVSSLFHMHLGYVLCELLCWELGLESRPSTQELAVHRAGLLLRGRGRRQARGGQYCLGELGLESLSRISLKSRGGTDMGESSQD